MEHELKTWPEYLGPVVSGLKTFEYRIDDRGFAVGDTLLLREWDPSGEEYTGRSVRVRITYIFRRNVLLDDGCIRKHCVMSIVKEDDLKERG